MIKNYIFDFGNVLTEFYPDKLTAPYVPDKETERLISEIVFDRLYWARLDDGTITDEEVKSEIIKRLPVNLGDVACKVYDSWVRTLTPVKGMEKLISDISKTDKKIYLLSNISIGFAETYPDVEWIKNLFDYFDGLVFSGVVGMVKPDACIFEYLLNKYDLKAEESIFIDDSPINVKGAEAVGIKGYLFDGDADKLRKYLGI